MDDYDILDLHMRREKKPHEKKKRRKDGPVEMLNYKDYNEVNKEIMRMKEANENWITDRAKK